MARFGTLTAAVALLAAATARASPLVLVQISARSAENLPISRVRRDVGSDVDQLLSDLPEVDDVMTNTSTILHALKSQTMVLETIAAKQQEARKAALAETRAKYREEMTEQAALVATTHEANEGLKQTIDQVSIRNERLRADVDALRQNNTVIKDSLKALSKKLGAATSFIGDTLSVTDDENSEVLQRAQAPTQPPTVKDLLRESRFGGAVPDKVSLLQVAQSPVQAYLPELLSETSSPEATLKALAQHINNLAAAEEAGAERIKDKFDQLLDAQKGKYETELGLQKDLNATLEHEIATLQALRAAKKHLISTRKELLLRVGGLQIFVDRMQKDLISMLEAAGAGSGSGGVVKAAAALKEDERGSAAEQAQPKQSRSEENETAEAVHIKKSEDKEADKDTKKSSQAEAQPEPQNKDVPSSRWSFLR